MQARGRGSPHVRTHADAAVAFTDVDQSAAEAAANAVGGRAVASDAAETFDVVCIAVPMPVAETASTSSRRVPRTQSLT